MGGIGGPELLIIFVVVLLVFGPRRLPEIARGIGKGVREFRKLGTEFQREMNISDALERDIRASGSDSPPSEGPPGGADGANSGDENAFPPGTSSRSGPQKGPSEPPPTGSGDA